ncbi:hypothetical protein GCM10009559_33610 [Pseudonocardia zijingensis]|uniref:Uncharacterized protein n=2 Tax=Pseudonocardia zijingensis TaxID=153376 RepID=A0ABP4ARU9_9PSEU
MILDSPGTSPSVIAHAHGFSAVEIAELLPIFVDNLRTDFSSADGPAPELVPPVQQPDETAEEHADRYLRELAQDARLDVVGYDTLGSAAVDDLDGLRPVDVPAEVADDSVELDGGAPDAQPAQEGAGPVDDLVADDPFAEPAPVEPAADEAYVVDGAELGAPDDLDDPLDIG